MKLVSLRGEHFRNIHSLDVSLSPHLNVLYGDNGSGKSTVLEMIYCLSRGRSFRTHVATPIIQYEKSFCTVFGKVEKNSFSTSIGFKKDANGKTQLKIGSDTKKPTHKMLSELLPVQLFHPESHDFLKGGPALRRKFVDWGLFYTEPLFFDEWHRFYYTLKQRNAALAQKQPEQNIRIWDSELIKTGERLSYFRHQYVNQLIQSAKTWFELLLKEIPVIEYYPGWSASESLSSALNSGFARDTKQGYTTVGPHRFDVLLKFRQLAVENIFSRGEQKRLICSLYLAQGEIFERTMHTGCLYLLDDILSELDAAYQSKVLNALVLLDAQVVMTSLAPSLIKPLLRIDTTKEFCLTKGAVRDQTRR